MRSVNVFNKLDLERTIFSLIFSRPHLFPLFHGTRAHVQYMSNKYQKIQIIIYSNIYYHILFFFSIIIIVKFE